MGEDEAQPSRDRTDGIHRAAAKLNCSEVEYVLPRRLRPEAAPGHRQPPHEHPLQLLRLVSALSRDSPRGIYRPISLATRYLLSMRRKRSF